MENINEIRRKMLGTLDDSMEQEDILSALLQMTAMMAEDLEWEDFGINFEGLTVRVTVEGGKDKLWA
ncbi:MAG: hypothetical protein ACRCZ0_10145 [Cetobacterium sp.]